MKKIITYALGANAHVQVEMGRGEDVAAELRALDEIKINYEREVAKNPLLNGRVKALLPIWAACNEQDKADWTGALHNGAKQYEKLKAGEFGELIPTFPEILMKKAQVEKETETEAGGGEAGKVVEINQENANPEPPLEKLDQNS